MPGRALERLRLLRASDSPTHQRPLLCGEGAVLHQHAVGYADLADVVKEGCGPDGLDVVVGQPDRPRQRDRERSHLLAVPTRDPVAGVHRGDQGLKRAPVRVLQEPVELIWIGDLLRARHAVERAHLVTAGILRHVHGHIRGHDEAILLHAVLRRGGRGNCEIRWLIQPESSSASSRRVGTIGPVIRARVSPSAARWAAVRAASTVSVSCPMKSTAKSTASKHPTASASYSGKGGQWARAHAHPPMARTARAAESAQLLRRSRMGFLVDFAKAMLLQTGPGAGDDVGVIP